MKTTISLFGECSFRTSLITLVFLGLNIMASAEEFYLDGGTERNFIPDPSQVTFTCVFNTIYRMPEDILAVSLSIIEIEYHDGKKETANYISWDLSLRHKLARNTSVYSLNKMIAEEYLKNSGGTLRAVKDGDAVFSILNERGERLNEFIASNNF